MASLIPPSKSRGADASVGEALRNLAERVARLETIVELVVEQGAEVPADKAPAEAPDKTPAVAPEQDAKPKTGAKSA
jgi:hypothetical protein